MSVRARMNLDRNTPFFFSSSQYTARDKVHESIKQPSTSSQKNYSFEEGSPEKRYALWRLAELEGKYDQIGDLHLQDAIRTVRSFCQEEKRSDEGCLEVLQVLLAQLTE
jgi:hypothetical protein